jgi:hypothetical protein
VPTIAKGPATVLGQTVVGLLAASTAVFSFVRGDHTPEALTAMAGAVVTALALMAGRYAQSYALIKAAPAARPGPSPWMVHCCCRCHRSFDPDTSEAPVPEG